MNAPERPTTEETSDRWFKASANPHEWPVTGQVWIDMHQVNEDNEDILNLARRLTRLTLFAINGMLVDQDGSGLELADVRLIQEVAWAADMCMSEVGKRYLDDDGKERPILRDTHHGKAVTS